MVSHVRSLHTPWMCALEKIKVTSMVGFVLAMVRITMYQAE